MIAEKPAEDGRGKLGMEDQPSAHAVEEESDSVLKTAMLFCTRAVALVSNSHFC